jgi:spore photoproduct lyase
MLLKRFSHIYLEEGAEAYPLTRNILDRLPNSTVVSVANYMDVFGRSGQNFQMQKQSPKLILARKKDKLIYDGSMASQSFGYRNFYYNSLLLNCVYNCDYCYLQGMYPSGNMVVFVNEDDFYQATLKAIDFRPFPEEPLYLCISYDTDLLAYENVVPYATRFIEFTRENEDLVIEIRTKSANWRPLEDVLPNERCILAWTLSPPEVAVKYEKLTPSHDQRIEAIKQCLDRGWPVRLCFDPVLKIDNWEEIYGSFFKDVFKRLPAEKIRDVSLGVFRMNADYFKRIKKQRTDSDILFYPFENSQSFVSYPQDERSYMIESLKAVLLNYLPAEKIETWT